MSDIFDVDNPGEERVDLAPEMPDDPDAVTKREREALAEADSANPLDVLAGFAAFTHADDDDDDEPYPQGPAEDIITDAERVWGSYNAAFRKYKDALAAEFETLNAYTDARQDAYAEGKLTTVVVAKDGTTTVKFIGGNETERELHERHVLGAIAQILDEAKQARRLAEVELEFWKEGTRQVETTIRLNDLLLRAR